MKNFKKLGTYISSFILIVSCFIAPINHAFAITNLDGVSQNYIGFYNGLTHATLKYSIGTSNTVDKTQWGKSITPILIPREGLFDSGGLNAPFPIQVGEKIYVYYAGNNGTNWNGIGLAVFTKDLHILSRPRTPVLTYGTEGEWDDSKIFRPVVVYEPNAPDPNKKFAMFYNGANSLGINQTGLAYSSDGIHWTKYSNNPVLSNGLHGEWDSQWAFPDSVIKVNEAYYMAYNGYNGKNVQTGIATSNTLEGPWVKHSSNPILKTRPNAVQSLTSDAEAGSTIVSVSDSSVFEIDEPIYLTSSIGTENVRVKSKPTHTTIELYEPTVFNHKVNDDASLRSVLSKSAGPNQLEYDGTKWRLYGSSWGAVAGYETTTYAEGFDLSLMNWYFSKMPTLNYDTVVTQDWDSKSQENLKFINIK